MRSLAEKEPLVVARNGAARLAVPMRQVAQVLPAALPVSLPGAEVPLGLRLEQEVVPLVFASAMFDEPQLSLMPEHKVLLVRSGDRLLGLWVDAVEEIIPFVPLPSALPPTLASRWVAGLSSGEPTVPVLDVEALFQGAPELSGRLALEA